MDAACSQDLFILHDLTNIHLYYYKVESLIFFGLIDSSLEGLPREQKMLKGHLPRVIYHLVY